MTTTLVQALIRTNAVASLSSRQTMDGEEHIVIPVVALVSGILNGIYYSPDEIQTFAQAWNGVPVPVTHPKEGENFVNSMRLVICLSSKKLTV